MKRTNKIQLILVILTILISKGVVYSQSGYWEPTAKICKTSINNIYNLSVADNGNIWAVAAEGIFYSTNNGDTWIKTTNNGLNITGDPKSKSTEPRYLIACAIEHPISGSIFIGGQKSSGMDFSSGALFRLSKDGEFWEKVLDLSNSGTFLFMDMVVKSSGDIYVVGEGSNDGCNIYYSSDNGDTWIGMEKIEGLNTTGFNKFRSFKSLALATDGTLYAAGRYGVYRLDDGMDTWVKILDVDVSQITVSIDGSIFVATGSGVFKSIDKGVTWKANNSAVNCVVYNPVTDHLFVASDHLVYISTDLGESWNSDITNNLPVGGNLSNDISSFAVNPKTGMVFVSYVWTTNREVYRLKVTSKEDIEFFIGDERPTLVLENYPNPFNPITTIQYHLGENALVTLKVYDIMGREIATLINNKMQLKGSYSSTFNASGLSSGIYFYTLFANGKPYTQKMLLTK